MIPQDPVMLLSFINLKLRDYYGSLEQLCDDLDRSSIRTTLRYNSVIPTLSLKAFLPAGKQISRK